MPQFTIYICALNQIERYCFQIRRKAQKSVSDLPDDKPILNFNKMYVNLNLVDLILRVYLIFRQL